MRYIIDVADPTVGALIEFLNNAVIEIVQEQLYKIVEDSPEPWDIDWSKKGVDDVVEVFDRNNILQGTIRKA